MTTYQFPSSLLSVGSNTDDGGAGLSLGFETTPQVSGLTATGLRWYAPAAMTVTPYLFDGSGAQLAVGPAVACSPGWNNLPFTTAKALTSGTLVIPTVFQASTQKYSATGSVWPASTTQFTSASGAGKYNYSATPGLSSTSGGSPAWFGIDIVATDGSGGATTYPLAGTVAGTTGASGSPKLRAATAGAAAAVSAVTAATIGAVLALSGTAAAVSSAQGAPAATHPLSGSAAATSTAAGAPVALLQLSSSATGTSGSSGAIGTVTGASLALSGSVAATSGTGGVIAALGALSGHADAVSGATGAPTSRQALSGAAPANSGASGAIALRAGLAGTVSAVSTAAGAIKLADEPTVALHLAGAPDPDRWGAAALPDRFTASPAAARWTTTTEDDMTVIYLNQGYTSFVGGTITDQWGTDLTSVDVKLMLVPTSDAPPDAGDSGWKTPDVNQQGATIAQRTVRLAVSGVTPAGLYRLWARVTANPTIDPVLIADGVLIHD